MNGNQPAPTDTARHSHRTELVTLVFTDIVGSTALKQQLGDNAGAALIQQHHALVREVFKPLADAEEISTAGDSFLIRFAKPSDAVKFALLLQSRLRTFNQGREVAPYDRIGVHLGEVVIAEEQAVLKPKDLYGMHVDTCARVMGLAHGGQILLTRAVFDSARQALKGEDIPGVGLLNWLNHGLYQLKGIEEAVEICEVGEVGAGPLRSPATTEKARRVEAPEGEAVLGWRPAVGQVVPNTQWVLEKKLGEGGFGEVWLGRHLTMKERRVFKFCFRADRVRSLKREMTLFRVLKERMGDHPNIVRLLEVYFEEPPFYVVMDHVEGQDLKAWCEQQGGVEKVPLASRLEIVAQIADALQAAHDAGVIHRDVKPGNILISGGATTAGSPLRVQAKLTDFGIGQVVSEEALRGVTKAGFTQTIIADSSSSQTGSQMYMAPELLAGKPASTRSDIYSLGVVLYQLRVGDLTRPVTTDWANDVPEPLLREDLHHCFAGNPQDRYAGAGLLAKNLRALPQRQATLAAQQVELAARERAAYRRGVVRAATIGVFIAAALLVLSVAAVRQSRRAIAERELARREGYAADMNLIQQAWKGHNLRQARGLLERHRPRGKDSDLRQWEWRYWWSQCKSDESSVVLENLAPVPSIALSSDGRHLAMHQYTDIVLLDLESRREMTRLPNTGMNRALAFSPDGNVLAYGGLDSRQRPEITLWDARQRAAVGHLTNTARVALVEFTRDSRYLASISSDGFVRVWDLKTQSCAASIPLSGAHIHKGAACFSPDGQSLAIGELDGRIRLVDWRSGKERWQTRLPISDGVTALAFSPDGQSLASGQGYAEARVFVLGARTGELHQTLVGHTSWISTLVFAEAGDRLFSASADQTIGVWSLALGKPIRFLRGHSSEVWHLRLSADGRRLYSCGKEGSIRAWDGTVQPSPPAYRTAREAVLGFGEFTYSALAFSRGDGALLTVTPHGQVVLWNTETLAVRETLDKLGTNNTSLALSPNDRWLAVGDRSGLMRIWDRPSSQLVTEFHASTLPVLECCFDEEGRALLIEVADENRTYAVAEWEVATWKRKENLFRLPEMGKIAVAPDGRHVAWGSVIGKSMRMWDRLKNRLAIEVSAHTFSVDSIGFSPTGLLLASASRDGFVKIWDARQRRLLASLASQPLGVHSLTFSPGGQRLATGSVGLEAIKLWDVATFREVMSLEAGAPLRLIRFSWDGNMLVGASDDGTLFVWRAPSFTETDAAEKADAAGMRR